MNFVIILIVSLETNNHWSYMISPIQMKIIDKAIDSAVLLPICRHLVK